MGSSGTFSLSERGITGCKSLGLGFSSPQNGEMFGEVGVARGVGGTPCHGHHHLAGVSRGCNSSGGWGSRCLPLCRHWPYPRSFPDPDFIRLSHQPHHFTTSIHCLIPQASHQGQQTLDQAGGQRLSQSGRLLQPLRCGCQGRIWTPPSTGDHEQDGILQSSEETISTVEITLEFGCK